jgi:hypothetical protein
MYENEKISPDETIPGMRKENYGWGEFNYDIL